MNNNLLVKGEYYTHREIFDKWLDGVRQFKPQFTFQDLCNYFTIRTNGARMGRLLGSSNDIDLKAIEQAKEKVLSDYPISQKDSEKLSFYLKKNGLDITLYMISYLDEYFDWEDFYSLKEQALIEQKNNIFGRDHPGENE